MKAFYSYLSTISMLMRATLRVLFILLITHSPAQSGQDDVPKPSKEYHIVILGDEISDDLDFSKEFKFSNLLREEMSRPAKSGTKNTDRFIVNNLSHEGASITSATTLIEQVKELKPDIVIIQLGRNDALEQQEIYVVESALANLINDIRRVRAYPLLIGDTPPSEVPYSYATRYNVMLRQIANGYGALFLPEYVRSLSGKWELFMTDGVVPNEEGRKVLVTTISPMLQEMVERIRKQRFAHYEKLLDADRKKEEMRRRQRNIERNRRIQEESRKRIEMKRRAQEMTPEHVLEGSQEESAQ